MATELAAPQLSEGSRPAGSIILDDLLRRYLISVGLKRFRRLSVTELKCYALLAVYNVIKRYGLEGISVEDFWEWMKPGETYGLARLLPATDEGRAYHAEQVAQRRKGADAEETVILPQVENVRLCIRAAFVNLIVDDLEKGDRYEALKNAVTQETAPATRRGRQSEEGQQSLDEILRHVRGEREGGDLEAARLVMRRVREKMTEQQLRVVDLLYDDYAPREAAAALGVKVQYVYNTKRAYRAACMRLWNRLFGSERQEE